jgi:hypothetical protein
MAVLPAKRTVFFSWKKLGLKGIDHEIENTLENLSLIINCYTVG